MYHISTVIPIYFYCLINNDQMYVIVTKLILFLEMNILKSGSKWHSIHGFSVVE